MATFEQTLKEAAREEIVSCVTRKDIWGVQEKLMRSKSPQSLSVGW